MSQGRYVSGELVRSVYVVNMSSGGGSGTPGGSDTQIQFNNAGVFGGVANSSVNNATGNITLGNRVSVPLGTAALPSIYPGTDTNTGIYSPGADQLAVATNGTGRCLLMFINANAGSSAAEISLFAGGINVGNVGIGTTSWRYCPNAPAYNTQLEIASSGTANALISAFDATASRAYFQVGGTTSGRYTQIGTDTSTTFINDYFGTGIAFQLSASEKARIDSSGRLLVGTSTALSTDSIFQVKSSNPANVIEISRRANDSSPARFNFSKTRGDATDIVLNNDTIGEILFRASDGVVATPIAAGISTHVDGTPGPNDMPGRLVFSTTADGASSPTERMRITSDAYVRLAAGTGGIQFNGDTAAANALDDYEEGTWTPTLTLSSTQFTAVNYNSWTKGYYRKIGSLVHVQGVLITNDIDAGPGAGAVRIGGLPFASPANSSGENFTGTSSISVGFADAWTSVQPSTAEVVTNSSLIALYAENATGERTALTAANVTDANFANVIRFAGTYISV
jgi:hypothetical protein